MARVKAKARARSGARAKSARTAKAAPKAKAKAGTKVTAAAGAAKRPAAPRPSARVVVDARKTEPLRRIWRYAGYDEPNYTYTPNGRALLVKLGGMADGPYFIRCHFMLCTGDGTGRPKWGSTNAYTEDAAGNPVYSWDIIDRILDTQIATGCIPFVELGFMPKALTTGPVSQPYDDPRHGTWRFPPRDYEKWRGLIRALGHHCVERYGLRQVSQWYWELWNEPDIFYWQGTVQEYCRLFDYTEAGLHEAVPQARLGGPATTSPARPEAGRFLRSFLEHCARGANAVSGRQGTRLDYITIHTKGGGYRVDPKAAKTPPTQWELARHVAEGLKIMGDFPELKGLEVNLSECDPDGWAAGTRHDNPNLNYRNTEYYASYIANSVCKLMDLGRSAANQVDGMLTWAFQFENRPLFEGLRTLSTNGVDKAALNVFRLLARLGGNRLAFSSNRARDPLARAGGDAPDAPPDLSGLAAGDGEGRIHVLLSCHHDDWDVQAPATVALQLRGLAPRQLYSVVTRTIDRAQANPYAAWVALGSPAKATASQMEVLKRAALLKPRKLRDLTADASGGCEMSIVAATHSVTLIELTPVHK